MKKILLLATLSAVCFSSVAFAKEEQKKSVLLVNSSDTELKLEGFFGFQSGYVNQNHLVQYERNISDNRKKLAFYTDAAFVVTVSQEFNNVLAGAKISIQTTNKEKSGAAGYGGSHIFLESEHGRIEAGAPFDASTKMRITGYKVAVGGTGWSKYATLSSLHTSFNGVKAEFDPSDSFDMESYANNFDTINDKVEAARRVSYYTPKYNGFQFGISYTPDSANTGGNKDINSLTLNSSATTGITTSRTGITTIALPDGSTMTLNRNVKNAVSGGISYEHQIADDIALQIALTGEYGKPARQLIKRDKSETIGKLGNQTGSYKLSDLKAYNLGAVLTYGNFSCSASYGSLGKSLTTAEYHKGGRNTNYYNGALAYGQGPIKTSISYFRSSRYKNTVDTVSVGTEYKLTPGVLPYAEVAYFQAKGRPVYYPDAPKNTTKGTVGLIGAKLKF